MKMWTGYNFGNLALWIAAAAFVGISSPGSPVYAKESPLCAPPIAASSAGRSSPAKVSPKNRALIKSLLATISAKRKVTSASHAIPHSGVQSGTGPALASITPPEIDPRVLKLVSHVWKMVSEGDRHVKQGEWDEAVVAYQEAASLDPDCSDSFRGLAQCAAAAGDIGSEIGYYRLAIYTNRPSGEMGRLVHAPPAPDHMEMVYTYGDGFQEGDPSRLMKFALLLNQAGEETESLRVYRKAISVLDYDNGHTNPGLPILLPDLGPGGAAYTPQRLQAMAQLAIAIGTNDHPEKLARMKEAVRLAPDSAAAWYYLGDCEFHDEGRDATRKCYERARQLGDASVQAFLDKELSTLRYLQ